MKKTYQHFGALDVIVNNAGFGTGGSIEELLQEVFYKLWKNRENLRHVQSFPPYLFRMSANLVTDFYRKAALDKRLQEQLIYSTSELYDHIEDQN